MPEVAPVTSATPNPLAVELFCRLRLPSSEQTVLYANKNTKVDLSVQSVKRGALRATGAFREKLRSEGSRHKAGIMGRRTGSCGPLAPPAPPSIGLGPSGSITLGDDPTALPPPPPATTRSAPEGRDEGRLASATFGTAGASDKARDMDHQPLARVDGEFRVHVGALAAQRRKAEGRRPRLPARRRR